MSCNYADALSPYENKGVLGLPEKFDCLEEVKIKCKELADLIDKSNHVVIHTGAGISTSAGIPDFRGPNGVWTLEQKGKKPEVNVSFIDAKPSKTHMILKKLIEIGKIKYIVSQNIDGLHLKSGINRKYLSELHGNMFIEECNVCARQFIKSSPVETVGKRTLGKPCLSNKYSERPCRGNMYDNILDWEHELPEKDLQMAEMHSSIADLSICLGTSLQIKPSGSLPLETLKYHGKLVICNLQATKHDNKADLKINYYVDAVMENLINIYNIDIPEYLANTDPTKISQDNLIPIEWTIFKGDIDEIERVYKSKCKNVKKVRCLVKTNPKESKKRKSNTAIDLTDG